MHLQFTKNIGTVAATFVCDTDVLDFDMARSLAIRNNFAFDLLLPPVDEKLINSMTLRLSDLLSFLSMDDLSRQSLISFYQLPDDTQQIVVTEMQLGSDGAGTINIDRPDIDSGISQFPKVGCGFSFSSAFQLSAADISQGS